MALDDEAVARQGEAVNLFVGNHGLEDLEIGQVHHLIETRKTRLSEEIAKGRCHQELN